MRHVHDRGGWPDAGPIERAEHDYSMWAKRTDAMLRVLTRDKPLIRVDALRRATRARNTVLELLSALASAITPIYGRHCL